MIEEEFRSVKGYEGLYEVSNYGRVRSLKDNNGQARILVLKPSLDKDGYEHLQLYRNSKHKTYKVHRLVAEAFIPNPLGLPCVNHKDEVKSNNHVWNLEWCTVKYNTNYGTAIERISKRVYQYTKDGSFVRSYASTREVQRRTGIPHSNICACCLGKYKTMYGYRWSYDPPTSTTNRALF